MALLDSDHSTCVPVSRESVTVTLHPFAAASNTILLNIVTSNMDCAESFFVQVYYKAAEEKCNGVIRCIHQSVAIAPDAITTCSFKCVKSLWSVEDIVLVKFSTPFDGGICELHIV